MLYNIVMVSATHQLDQPQVNTRPLPSEPLFPPSPPPL